MNPSCAQIFTFDAEEGGGVEESLGKVVVEEGGGPAED